MIALGLGQPRAPRGMLTEREYHDLLAVVASCALSFERDREGDEARFLADWVSEMVEEAGW